MLPPRSLLGLFSMNRSSILTVQLLMIYSAQIDPARAQIFSLGNNSRAFPVECAYYEFYPRRDSIDKIRCPSSLHVCCTDVAISYANACCLSADPKLELLMVSGICLQIMLFCFCFMYLLKNYVFVPLSRRCNRLLRSDIENMDEENQTICARNDRPPSFDELLEINANFLSAQNDNNDVLPKYEELRNLAYARPAHD